jgi:hypothetical protein
MIATTTTPSWTSRMIPIHIPGTPTFIYVSPWAIVSLLVIVALCAGISYARH